jgi:CHASE3 domain sensor protein
MGSQIDRGVITGIGLLAAMMVGIAGTSYLNTRKLRNDAEVSSHSLEVIDGVGSVRTDARRLQASQRAYLITGIEDWLAPYHETTNDLRAGVARLKSLTKNDPDQLDRAQEADREIEAAIANLNVVITLRREKGFDAVLTFSRQRGIRSFVDPSLEKLAEMDRYERQRLAVLYQEAGDAYSQAVLYSVAAAILGLVALGLFTWLLSRSVRNRVQYAELRSLAGRSS